MCNLGAMEINRLTRRSKDYPEPLRHISSPPAQLFHMGADLTELMKRPRVAIIGSRLPTMYGRQVTHQLASELAAQGVVIVSGLALGVDGLSHQAALEAGGLCLAVLPGSLEHIYPATNRRLAEKILDGGGALVSEYGEEAINYKTNFIARNRLIAGLSQAVLVTEAAAKSGSQHTVTFAEQQNRDVLAVPGNITSKLSVGTNNMIKANATPVTCSRDVLLILNINPHRTLAKHVRGRNHDEQAILDLLLSGISDGEELLKQSGLDIARFNQTITMLEISAKIRSLGLNHWSIY